MVGWLFICYTAVAILLAGSSQGFTPPSSPRSVVTSSMSSTQLQFGIPKFLEPKQEGEGSAKDGDEYKLPKKDLSLSGIIQLITAGAGSPFLGDFEGIDEETGNFMFSLEANNLVDENGNSKQTQMPYFEQGWVDPDDLKKAEGGFKWPWQK